MNTRVRSWMVGGATLVLLVGCAAALLGKATDDDEDIKAAIEKIATNLQNNDLAAAKKAADALPSDLDPGDAMGLMELRKPGGKGGVGIGARPGTVRPDGIEKMVQNLAKSPPSKTMLTRDNAALKRAVYMAAAIGEAVQNHSPVKAPEGKKNPADWKKWASEMRAEALELTKVIDTKDPKQVNSAASKLNDTCTRCHEVFKD